jgi:CheY-like chemotaxis protein
MTDLSRCTVLLVDDAEENLDILVETLGNELDLTVATDGESALEILTEEIPDLILLDIEMPGMDGFEVCRRIKANPVTESIPIIFLSGRSLAPDRAKGKELGAVDFITKPFVAADVLARARTALAAARCAEGN